MRSGTDVGRLRREHDLGLSEALNQQARAGIDRDQRPRERVQLKTRSLNLRIDVSNVAEALEATEPAEQPGPA